MLYFKIKFVYLQPQLRENNIVSDYTSCHVFVN